MKKQLKIINSDKFWNEKKRYKVNDVVSYNNVDYQNVTGGNSIPSNLVDWFLVDYEPSLGVEIDVVISVNSSYLTTNYPNAKTGFKVYQNRSGFPTIIYEKTPSIWITYQAFEVL